MANLRKLNGLINNLTALINWKLSGVALWITFLFMASSSLAQERHDNPMEESFQVSEDLTDSLEMVEVDQELPHDNLEPKPIPPSRQKADGTTHKSKSEEETLSFNFLYFIIQKFKVSDLVED